MTTPDPGQCSVCGQWVPYDADQGTMWGRVTDLEPPDPDYYCEKCARAQRDKAVAQGVIPCWWLPPQWAKDAQAVIDDGKEPNDSTSS